MRESDRKFIQKINVFYLVAVIIMIFGLSGIGLGLWVQFYRPSSSGELMLNRSLIMLSIGIIFSALIHFQSLGIIKRLNEQINT
jgi:hypothetical protein